jgi:ABC-2 type transport system ATP-binding protein
LIDATHVTKRYGPHVALDDVSFSIPRGEIVALLGPNGAGKTTTLRILSCFMPPTSGRVLVAGADTVRESDRARRSLGYLPERVPLYDDIRVEVYLRFRARLKGLRGPEVRAAVDASLSRTGLVARRMSWIGALSKGLRQRVGIADAIIHRPAVIILDEPTSGLDPDQRVSLRALVRELAGEHTVVVSTHILPEAEATCEHVLVIHRGRIRLSAPLRELQGPDRGESCLVFDGAAAAARAVAAAVHAGRDVLEVAAERPSLESLFLRLTSTGEDAS